ncbi:MAG: energy-coupled thiamine transporter ThiT [Clostridia bacterium]|nr:energy-coupled thiamine transporter ThiT [Clostridia bacterium]
MFLNTLLAEETTVWYPFLFDTPQNAVRAVAIWLTLAALIAFAVGLTLIKGEKRAKFLKISLICAIAYACVLAIVSLVFGFLEDGIKPILCIPLLVLILTIALSGILLIFKQNRVTLIAAGVAVGGALVAALVCMGVHFASGEAAEDNWLTNEQVGVAGLWISAVILIAAVIAVAFLLDRKSEKGFSAKSVAYAAVCIAMSFALSYLRIVQMPQGGAITVASLLPLMIYSYMFGTKKGVFAGMIYGLLQAIQDPYILHPAQFILDYPAAFACIGLAGAFSAAEALEKLPQLQFALGAGVACLGRFLMHFIAGIFAFGAFAPEGTNVILYSLGYQASYILADMAIVIVVGIFVFSSRAFVKMARSYKPTVQTKVQTAE